MAVYFFDCFDGSKFLSDVHGVELPDVDEMMDHGACLARELLRETTSSAGSLGVSVMVRNLDGALVYTAHCCFYALGLPEQSQ